jgi:translation elongation factor EF-G
MAGVLAKPIELAIEAQARTDQERLWVVLEMLAAVDRSVGVMVDRQTGHPTAWGLWHDLRSLCADTGTGRRRAVSACGRYARVSFRSVGVKCLDAS